MAPAAFFIYTIIAGSLFAFALLWAIAAWMKADEEAERAEKRLEEARSTVRPAVPRAPDAGRRRDEERLAS